MMQNETGGLAVGQSVEWGPEGDPLGAGIVRYFTSDGEFAFVKDERGVFFKVPVAELRDYAG